jgi:flagellar motor component MotA
VNDLVETREMILEGVLALQAGDSPVLIRKKMNTFLSADVTNPLDKGDADETES